MGDLIDYSADLANMLKPSYLYSTIKYEKRFLLECIMRQKQARKWQFMGFGNNQKRKIQNLVKLAKKTKIKLE